MPTLIRIRFQSTDSKGLFRRVYGCFSEGFRIDFLPANHFLPAQKPVLPALKTSACFLSEPAKVPAREPAAIMTKTLMLGSYPIVKTSSLDSLYEGLPVLIVKNWTDITIQLLHATYEKFQSTEWDYGKLYVQYWKEIFHSHFVEGQ